MRHRTRATKKIPNPPEWLTVGQVAELLQVSRVTVWRWIRVRRISQSRLQQLTRQGRKKNTPLGAGPRVLGTAFTLAHPLWELVGKGRGGGANVSGNKYRFVSGSIDPR